MFFAEALSGSSVLWFINVWALLVTFWLYLAHILLFVNLALIFKRTSITALYLWGVLFGLYEAWITKVTWAGYIGSTPGMGKLLGFAIPEFPLIVFFWHPVFSFILPLLTFELLSGHDRILPGHRGLLTGTRRNWLLALFCTLIGATFLSTNAKNVFAAFLTIAGSAAIIWILYRIASKRYGRQFSIESLRLGKKGMAVLIVYLALLYSVTFFGLVPERIAPPFTILLTTGVYAAIVILLYLKKPDEPVAGKAGSHTGLFRRKDTVLLLAALTVLAVIFSLIAPVDFFLIIFFYLFLVVLGPVLFIMAVFNVRKDVREAGRRTRPNHLPDR